MASIALEEHGQAVAHLVEARVHFEQGGAAARPKRVALAREGECRAQ